jgi:predicted nucleic acid-binding Zn ribbon protein
MLDSAANILASAWCRGGRDCVRVLISVVVQHAPAKVWKAVVGSSVPGDTGSGRPPRRMGRPGDRVDQPRGHGGRGVRRRLKDALPDSDERELMEPPQVPPGSARALVGGVPANARDLSRCPICGEPLRPRQRVCSGRCRAELSRRRQAQARQARDEQVRALLLAALALMGKDGPP